MSKNNRLKEYFEDNGIKISASLRRRFVQEYNNNEMPLSDRIAKILSGQDKKIIDFVNRHRCPRCNKPFLKEGTYCSMKCLKEDLPFK